VLLDPDSPAYLAPFARVVAGIGEQLPRLLDAYRAGGGIGYAEYGPEVADVQAALSRPLHVNLLGAHWLPAIPAVHARLLAHPPARVADLGCGGGWSSIAIARAYPKVRVTGFDLHPGSIDLARRNAEAAGVSDRVSFEVRDVADPALTGSYDLVLAFELTHDLPRPVDALRTMRRLTAPGGYVLDVDQRAAEQFSAPADPVQRLLYGISLFVCLPWGMAEQPSAATGTVMRPSTLRRYAQDAGFRDVEILPIEHDFFRFYHLIG
jgi:2-polyprenyl-3-methyl-5-hydroxy-6-metoxy-1,4-benzoquinol methylase